MVLQLVLVLQPVLPVKINIQLTSLWNLSREDRYDCNRFVTIFQAVNITIFCPFLYPLDFSNILVYNFT